MAFLTYQTLRCENIIPTKVVSTHLWYTPLNLCQKAKEGVFYDSLGGLPGGCSRGVLKQPVMGPKMQMCGK